MNNSSLSFTPAAQKAPAEIGEALATVQAKIAELEAKNARLRTALAQQWSSPEPSR